MKLSFKFSLLALLCLIVTSSCKKETPEPEKDIFSARIDGNFVDFTYNLVVKSDFMTSASGKMIRIVGDGPNGAINMNINDYNGVGEYNLNAYQRQVFAGYVKKGQGGQKEENYAITEARVQIISVTEDRIKGTFSFIAGDYSGTINKTIDGFFFLRYK